MRPRPLSLEDVEEPTPPHVTLALAPRIVHPRLGVVRSVVASPVDAPLHAFTAVASVRLSHRLAGLQPGTYGPAGEAEGLVRGTGVAADEAVARVRAMGEAVERYALHTTAHLPVERKTFAEVADRALRPDEVARVGDAEREVAPGVGSFSPDAVFPWVWATRFSDGDVIRVPAVFTHPRVPRPPAAYLTPAFPAGSAAANTLTEAVLSAATEAVERDALTLFWATRRSLPRVRLDSVADGVFHAVRAHMESRGWAFHIFDMTSDVGLPAFIAFIVDSTGRGPALAAGTGAGFDPVAAARRAAEEAVHMRLRLSQLLATGVGAGDALHWTRLENLADLDWLLGAPEAVDLPKAQARPGVRARLEDLISLLSDRNLYLHVVDATPPDAAALGLRVASVLVPGLLPKSYTPGFWHAATPRLVAAAGGKPLNPHSIPFA